MYPEKGAIAKILGLITTHYLSFAMLFMQLWDELVGEVFVQMPGLTARETGQFALYSSQSVENLSRMKV